MPLKLSLVAAQMKVLPANFSNTIRNIWSQVGRSPSKKPNWPYRQWGLSFKSTVSLFLSDNSWTTALTLNNTFYTFQALYSNLMISFWDPSNLVGPQKTCLSNFPRWAKKCVLNGPQKCLSNFRTIFFIINRHRVFNWIEHVRLQKIWHVSLI